RPLARAHAPRAAARVLRPAGGVRRRAGRAGAGGPPRRRERARSIRPREHAARAPRARDGEPPRVPPLLGRVCLRAPPPGDEPDVAAAPLLPVRVRLSRPVERAGGDHGPARARHRHPARARVPIGASRGERALMARALLENVGKRYGDVVALEGFSLDVADGELVTVLGPSGCGKSTLLRLIAGLEPMTDGAIRLDERRIDGLPPEDRDVAMVFQSYALYPHMTVRGNVEFPLRMRRVARAERRRRAQEVAELLEIGAMLDRRPSALSGGQRQRVALARALVRHPALFLLDEPLSNLDARLRASVRQYIRDVQRRLSVTTLYVTHDQTEAMTRGHRVVVLDRGRMQQVDTPLAVYERPANAFVAGFLGAPPMNLVPGEVAGGVLAVGDQRVDLRRAWRA